MPARLAAAGRATTLPTRKGLAYRRTDGLVGALPAPDHPLFRALLDAGGPADDRSRQRPRSPGSAPATPAPTPAAAPPGQLRRTRTWPSGSSAGLITTAVCQALCGSTPIITTAMTGISFRYPGAGTAAGTPNSRDHTGARAPLLSHATARPRQAGTSFESQAQQEAGRRKSRASQPGPLNATSQAHCHPGQTRDACQQLDGYRASCDRRAVTFCNGTLLPVAGKSNVWQADRGRPERSPCCPPPASLARLLAPSPCAPMAGFR